MVIYVFFSVHCLYIYFAFFYIEHFTFKKSYYCQECAENISSQFIICDHSLCFVSLKKWKFWFVMESHLSIISFRVYTFVSYLLMFSPLRFIKHCFTAPSKSFGFHTSAFNSAGSVFSCEMKLGGDATSTGWGVCLFLAGLQCRHCPLYLALSMHSRSKYHAFSVPQISTSSATLTLTLTLHLLSYLSQYFWSFLPPFSPLFLGRKFLGVDC